MIPVPALRTQFRVKSGPHGFRLLKNLFQFTFTASNCAGERVVVGATVVEVVVVVGSALVATVDAALGAWVAASLELQLAMRSEPATTAAKITEHDPRLVGFKRTAISGQYR